MEEPTNTKHSILKYLTIALSCFALGLYLGEELSNRKYESILVQYTKIGNQKIINCYEVLYGRVRNEQR
jgi:hypothetical protein